MELITLYISQPVPVVVVAETLNVRGVPVVL
jgi:hypothetical protein